MAVADVQLAVRQRITEYIEEHPNATGLTIVYGDILIEELYDNISGAYTVISFWNPSSALPSNPTMGASYISSATANGWTNRNIYIYGGPELGWVEVTYLLGRIVYVASEDTWYGAKAIGWTEIGSGGSSVSNPFYLAPFCRLSAFLQNDNPAHPEFWIELSTDGGITWQRKQRLFES